MKQWNLPFLCEDLRHFVSFAASCPSPSPLVFILAVFLHLIGRKNWRWICMCKKCHEEHCTSQQICENMYLAQDIMFQKSTAPDRSLLQYSGSLREVCGCLWLFCCCQDTINGHSHEQNNLSHLFPSFSPPHHSVSLSTSYMGILTSLPVTSIRFVGNMYAFTFKTLLMIRKFL